MEAYSKSRESRLEFALFDHDRAVVTAAAAQLESLRACRAVHDKLVSLRDEVSNHDTCDIDLSGGTLQMPGSCPGREIVAIAAHVFPASRIHLLRIGDSVTSLKIFN